MHRGLFRIAAKKSSMGNDIAWIGPVRVFLPDVTCGSGATCGLERHRFREPHRGMDHYRLVLRAYLGF